MSAEAGPRIKRHKSERFGFRGLDDFPNIYPHRVIDHLKLVNEGDIYTAENVFQ